MLNILFDYELGTFVICVTLKKKLYLKILIKQIIQSAELVFHPRSAGGKSFFDVLDH